MKTTVTKIALLAIALPLLLNACNTMEGVGEDIQKGGKKVEKEAVKNNNY